jgi:excisionase family DNA binding protein
MAADPFLIDPVSEDEAREIREIYDKLKRENPAVLVGPDDTRLELPPSVYKLLLAILQDMQDRKPIQLVHVNELMSTQAAADFLGVSRQFFVKELLAGKMPYHNAGKHKRVYFKDLVEYDKRRRQNRKEAIQNLARQSQELGIYDEFLSTDGDE